ncbi:MAG: hypoxanthine phosphoribosyltransferase [Chloroflexi bacterium]|nr:hypoxanthine phosphoribosyltransferase [Chloroflexota bacterium]
MDIPNPAYVAYLSEILVGSDAIQKRVQALGQEISQFYENAPDLLLVCVLKGGVMFLTDLMRHVSVPHAIDFMAVSSYGAGARRSSGSVRIMMDLGQDISGRDVLIVEDIIDSGHTLDYIIDQLRARKPASLRVCSLLSKPERREVDIQIDFLGFEIPDKFVFGYGLDLDEKFRNLPFIGVAKPGVMIE